MEIYINNQADFEMNKKMENILKQVIEVSLEKENFTDKAEVSVSFVNNQQIRQMNKRFRRIDKATDVLSFPLMGKCEIDENINLGDIIISIERAEEQAKEYGHSFEREFGFLTAHGMLHLLGYDHMDEDAEKEMFLKQEAVLKDCGLLRVSIPQK